MSDNPYRHPGGRTCAPALPLVLLMMPWALWRMWRDGR